MRELLSRGANAQLKVPSLSTPLHAASLCGNTECVRMLLAAGAMVNVRDASNCTPLGLACGAAVDTAAAQALLLAAGGEA